MNLCLHQNFLNNATRFHTVLLYINSYFIPKKFVKDMGAG